MLDTLDAMGNGLGRKALPPPPSLFLLAFLAAVCRRRLRVSAYWIILTLLITGIVVRSAGQVTLVTSFLSRSYCCCLLNTIVSRVRIWILLERWTNRLEVGAHCSIPVAESLLLFSILFCLFCDEWCLYWLEASFRWLYNLWPIQGTTYWSPKYYCNRNSVPEHARVPFQSFAVVGRWCRLRPRRWWCWKSPYTVSRGFTEITSKKWFFIYYFFESSYLCEIV